MHLDAMAYRIKHALVEQADRVRFLPAVKSQSYNILMVFFVFDWVAGLQPDMILHFQKEEKS